MERSVRWLACLAALALLPRCDDDDERKQADYGVVVNAIPGLPGDFIKGADVSMLAQLEASGGVFTDEDGTPKDCLQILKEHGVNWVRLRLWNQPVLAHDFYNAKEGKTIAAGEAAGGINDAARDLALALRAKALGMKVLLDFHYSDWWADPAQQYLPQAWEGYGTLAEVEGALYDFTHGVLADMAAAGAAPDMVQIGNEVTNGMMWRWGALTGGYDGFAALLSTAAAAVRAVDPAIPILLHLDKGGDNALYRDTFTTLIADGVDFDVIGLSYYPYWKHGTMAELRDNLDDVSLYFGKPVVIAETAWPWTTEDADAEVNGYAGTDAGSFGYLATVQGQTTFLRDLMELVAAVPHGMGLGVFYWEPEWIPVAGAGWYTQGGDGWDNQTLFDHAGKALPSLNVFRAVSEERAEVVATPVSVPAPAQLVTPVGIAPPLPDAVGVVHSDDSVRDLYVIWEDVAASTWDTAGTVEVRGTVAGTGLAAAQSVKVQENRLANPGFEAGDPTGWTVTPAYGTGEVVVKGSNVRTGSYAFTWWAATPFTFSLEQTLTGLDEARTYAFSFYAQGLAGEQLTAAAYCPSTAAAPTRTATVTLDGWASSASSAQWVLTGLAGLSGSSCRVVVSGVVTSDQQWGSLDDFTFGAE